MPHDQLRFDLLHGVHRHADHDQQRRAAEVERHAHALGKPRRQHGVEPLADERNRRDLEPAHQQLRQQRHHRQVQRADQCDARQDRVDVLRRPLAGPDARE